MFIFQSNVVYCLKLVGSPDDASLGFLRSDNARRYVRQLPQYVKQQFPSRFPNTSAGALDLLEKMLVFDPSKRITGTLSMCYNSCFSWFIHVSSVLTVKARSVIDMQLMRLSAIRIWRLSTTSMRSQPARALSSLNLSCRRSLRKTSRSSSGGSL